MPEKAIYIKRTGNIHHLMRKFPVLFVFTQTNKEAYFEAIIITSTPP